MFFSSSISIRKGELGECWNGYAQMTIAWIYMSPMLGSLVLNAIILIIIIALLVTKLKAQNATEREQIM